MKINILLHQNYYDYLTMFGSLDDVTDIILARLGENAYGLPKLIQTGDKCTHYVVNVTNEEYLDMVRIRGAKSSYCSLRRILYYAVDNNILEETVPILSKTVTDNSARFAECVLKISKLCAKATSYVKTRTQAVMLNDIIAMCTHLEEL